MHSACMCRRTFNSVTLMCEARCFQRRLTFLSAHKANIWEGVGGCWGVACSLGWEGVMVNLIVICCFPSWKLNSINWAAGGKGTEWNSWWQLRVDYRNCQTSKSVNEPLSLRRHLKAGGLRLRQCCLCKEASSSEQAGRWSIPRVEKEQTCL